MAKYQKPDTPETESHREEPESAKAAVKGPTVEDKEALLKDGWEKRVDPDGVGPTVYLNRREFRIPGNVVVGQGVARSLDEAHALEEQRLG